jgi:hypothetical protein
MWVIAASKQEGMIKNITLAQEAQQLPSMGNITVKVQPGDWLSPTLDLNSSPANFHLVHQCQETLQRDYQAIQELIQSSFQLENSFPETQTLVAKG